MRASLIAIGVFVVIFDIFLYMNPNKNMDANFIFNLAYSAIFLFGAIAGFIRAQKLKDTPLMSKAMLFLGLGMLFYTFGLFIWTYYNLVLKVEIPYPSYADWSFILYYPGVAIGSYFLIKSLGSRVTTKIVVEGALTFLSLFAIIYIFLTQSSLIGRVTIGATILDILYPLGDAFLAALAITILRAEKGASNYMNILYFAFGFIVLAIADTLFTYLSSNNLYWNGDISDLLFALSGFLVAWGIITIKE